MNHGAMLWYIPHVVLSAILIILTLMSFLHYRHDRRKKRRREAVLVRHDNTIRLVHRTQLNPTRMSRSNILCVFKGRDVDDAIRECSEIEGGASGRKNKTKHRSKWGIMRTVQLLGILNLPKSDTKSDEDISKTDLKEDGSHGNKVHPARTVKLEIGRASL